MSLTQKDLDELAQNAFRVNSHLLRIKDALRRQNAPEELQQHVADAQVLNAATWRRLEDAGAADPYRALYPERAAAADAALQAAREEAEAELGGILKAWETEAPAAGRGLE